MTGSVKNTPKNKPKNSGAKPDVRSSTKGRSSSTRAAQRQRDRRRGKRSGPTMWIVIGAVFVVGAALIIATVSQRGSSGGAATRSPVSAELLHAVTSVPQSVSDQVGGGSANALKAIDGPALTKDGKPLVQYVGAEYCPYCAAERWGLVIALSRFGTFSNLKTTASSPSDIYPSTPTFSFHGATYSSPYLAFDGREINSNVLSGSNYATLDVLSPSQQQLMATYDAPPYVAASATGTIPFADLGGKFIISGSAYNPGALSGMSAQEIADLLSNPSKASTQGILGTANHITASLCTLTGNQPASACDNATIKKLQANPGTSGSSGSSKAG